MNEDAKSISTETVASIARQVGLDTTPERHEQIRAEIAGGLEGYASLTADPTGWAPTADRDLDVTVDPGPDEDPHNAFTSLFEIDGGPGPLADLSVTVKDNYAVGGAPMTCGSPVFADAVPAADATVVERLLDAGATLFGKANMDELAYGPTGETSVFGPSENPAASGRVTGGSSSGSAAAVAGGHVDAAFGTDTGGSIRIPASFCDLVGVKPTWGTVPTDGVVELSYTLDHAGPLARDVRTAARALDAVVDGSFKGSFVDAVADPPAIESLTLGVPDEFFGDYVTETVERTVRERIDELSAAGATVREVSVPLVTEAVEMWNAVVNVEFATFLEAAVTPLLRHGRVDAAWHRDAAAGIAADDREFGDVVQRKAVEGKYVVRELDADPYVAARNRCRALADQFAAALDGVDALVTPTMATEPIEIGTWTPHTYSSSGADATPPLAVNTRPADLAGVPAMTLPSGNPETLPIGVQFIADRGEDAALLAIGAAFERFRDD
jgi:amidase/aspartyl-tRNA(Asn)/glutamyl-tRNA(Gln) amidotransferase subunit A